MRAKTVGPTVNDASKTRVFFLNKRRHHAFSTVNRDDC